MPKRDWKPSAKLIVLYEIEGKLGLTGKFAQAKLAKIETEALEKQETEAAQRMLVRDYQAASRQLAKEQSEERRLFESTRVHWREVMLTRQKVQLETIENRRNVLAKKQQDAKPLRQVARAPQNAGAAVITVRAGSRLDTYFRRCSPRTTTIRGRDC
jgi:hypothetical protein